MLDVTHGHAVRRERSRLALGYLSATGATFDPEAAALAAEEKAEHFNVNIDLHAPNLFTADLTHLGDGATTAHLPRSPRDIDLN